MCGSSARQGNRDPYDASEEVCGGACITKVLSFLKGSCKGSGV